MRAIFISYRRSDSEGEAGRLSDLLTHRFDDKSVFMDVDSIQPGRDFRKAIDESIQACSVVLTLIGPNWLDAHDDCGGRRLDAPNDYVRLEIAAALHRDIPVIPVLLRGAKMPHEEQLPAEIAELAFRNSVELTHARWKSDLQVLIDALEALIGAPPVQPPAAPAFTRTPPPPERRPEARPEPKHEFRPPAYVPSAPNPQPPQPTPVAPPQNYLSPSQRAAERGRMVSPNRNVDVVHPYRPPTPVQPHIELRPQATSAPAHVAPAHIAPVTITPTRAVSHPAPALGPASAPVAVVAHPVAAPAAPAPAPAGVQGSLPDASVDKISKHLAHFIGPIAEIVVKRAARQAGSSEDLALTVSKEIELPGERTKFLNLCNR